MDVLIPRPYGIVGMIGEMIAEGQLPSLKESIGLIQPNGWQSSMVICERLAQAGLARFHLATVDWNTVAIRKRPGIIWEYIAEQVEKQGGSLRVVDSRLPADPKMLGTFTKLIGEDFVELQWNDRFERPWVTRGSSTATRRLLFRP